MLFPVPCSLVLIVNFIFVRLLAMTTKSLTVKLEKFVFRFSDRFAKIIENNAPKNTFFDIKDFPWTVELEQNWLPIRKELENLLPERNKLPNFQDISPEQNVLTKDNNWKIYAFYAYGSKIEENCQNCPETTKSLEKIPGIKTAFFSILAPGKHIPEHTGVYKGVLRCHLGLIVPQPQNACRIRVKNDIATWSEGKCLIFDDTYPHEVWNETTGERVVLFIDFVRPLPFFLSIINLLTIRLINLTPFIRKVIKHQNEWNRKIKTNSLSGLYAGMAWQPEWLVDCSYNLMSGEKLIVFLDVNYSQCTQWLRRLSLVHQLSDMPDVFVIIVLTDPKIEIFTPPFDILFPLIPVKQNIVENLVEALPTAVVLKDGIIQEKWLGNLPNFVMERIKKHPALIFFK